MRIQQRNRISNRTRRAILTSPKPVQAAPTPDFPRYFEPSDPDNPIQYYRVDAADHVVRVGIDGDEWRVPRATLASCMAATSTLVERVR